MTQRTDPMFYNLTVEDIKTGEQRAAQVGCWWNDDHSAAACRRMCDCQLAGYFHAKPQRVRNFETGAIEDSWYNQFTICQATYLESNKCSHDSAKKFRALNVKLPGGDVIDLAA